MCYAQSDSSNIRKGKLFLNIGTEYRLTPLPYDSFKNDHISGQYIDQQNSGFALNYGLDYYITKNFNIGFGHAFRFVQLYSDRYHPYSQGYTQTVNRLVMDYHFFLNYHLKVFRKGELELRAGLSLMNTNSSFGYKDSYYDNNGTLLAQSYSNQNLNYGAQNLAIGYKKNKLEIMLGMYFSSNTNYFTEDITLKVPYVKLTYQIFKF